MTPTRAALWIVAGMAVFGVSDNLVPLLSDGLGLWQVMALRAGIAIPLALVFAALTGQLGTVGGRRPILVAIRSFLSATALLIYFSAMPAVGIALAAAGMFTSPFWILVISAVVLGERIGPRRIAAVLLGSAGMALVLGLGTVPVTPIMLLPMAAGMFYGSMVIWTRQFCAEETSLCLATWQQVAFVVLGIAGVLLTPWFGRVLAGVEGTEFVRLPWAAVSTAQWTVIATIGVTALVGTGLLATGYRSGPSSVVGLFDYSFLIWAPIFAWLLRGEVLSLRVAAGMALIAAAGALAIWAGREVRAGEAAADPPPVAGDRPV